MKLMNLMRKAFTSADYSVKAALGAAGETRPVPPRTYSRWNRNPMNAHIPLGPGDRVLPSGQIVAPDQPLPPGERLVVNEWTAGNIGEDYGPAASASSEIGAEFFAARQALADRRRQ